MSKQIVNLIGKRRSSPVCCGGWWWLVMWWCERFVWWIILQYVAHIHFHTGCHHIESILLPLKCIFPIYHADAPTIFYINCIDTFRLSYVIHTLCNVLIWFQFTKWIQFNFVRLTSMKSTHNTHSTCYSNIDCFHHAYGLIKDNVGWLTNSKKKYNLSKMNASNCDHGIHFDNSVEWIKCWCLHMHKE